MENSIQHWCKIHGFDVNDVNAKNSDGNTALMVASQKANLEVVRWFFGAWLQYTSAQ